MCFIFLSENMAVSYFLFCEILRALPFSPFLFCYFLYISDMFFMKSLLLKRLNGRLVRQFISLPLAFRQSAAGNMQPSDAFDRRRNGSPFPPLRAIPLQPTSW